MFTVFYIPSNLLNIQAPMFYITSFYLLYKSYNFINSIIFSYIPQNVITIYFLQMFLLIVLLVSMVLCHLNTRWLYSA